MRTQRHDRVLHTLMLASREPVKTHGIETTMLIYTYVYMYIHTLHRMSQILIYFTAGCCLYMLNSYTPGNYVGVSFERLDSASSARVDDEHIHVRRAKQHVAFPHLCAYMYV